MSKYIFIIYILVFFGVNSCGLRSYDPETEMSKEDYERKLSNKALGEDGIRMCRVEPPIPRLSKIVAVPENPKFNEEKMISISANEDVPIIDLLLEIGRIADVDVVVDKRIEGSIFLAMKNRPLFDVLDRICDFADLRYVMQNGTIVIEYDDPYLHTYDVSFLNIKRQNSSSINVSTSVVAGGSMNGGSSTSLSSSSQDTFWEDVMKNITQIIAGTQKISDTKRGISNQNNMQAQMSGSDGSDSNSPFGGITNALSGNNATGNNMNNNLNGGNNGSGSSVLANGQNANGASVTTPAMATGDSGGASNTNINISKSTGLMSVVTSRKGHEKIAKYLQELKIKTTAQVLIEVKLAEVTLSKAYALGIDWSYLKGANSIATSGLSTLSNPILTLKSTNVTSSNETITSTVNMLETFGTTKILASPRLMALNNQQAVLTFADNRVFFEISITSNGAVLNTGGGSVTAPTVSITSSPKTVPVGIVLTLQPSIDLKNKSVMLSVRPTLSRVKESIEDPGFNFAAKQAKVTDVPANMIPITSVREMDSILNMKDGDIMIMGGFTERSSEIHENGIPGLSKIPLIGRLFSKKTEEISVKEIVFIIKTTIVNENTDIQEYDKYFYKTFFSDPRELVF